EAGGIQRRGRRVPVRWLRASGDASGAAGSDQGVEADGERRHRHLPEGEAGRRPDRCDRRGVDSPAGTPPGPPPEIATVPAPNALNILPASRGGGPKGRRGRRPMSVPRITSPRGGEASIRSNPIAA